MELGKVQVTPRPLSTMKRSLSNAAPVTVIDSLQRKSGCVGAGVGPQAEESMGFNAGGRGFCSDSEERGSWVRTGGKGQINGCEFFNTNRASSIYSLLHMSTGRCGGCGTGEHPDPSKSTSTPTPSPFLLAGTWRRNKDWRVCLLSHLHPCTHAVTTEPLLICTGPVLCVKF